jgi:hypothetical protein
MRRYCPGDDVAGASLFHFNLAATNGGASGSYTYDGNGLRVKKVSGSTTTVYICCASRLRLASRDYRPAQPHNRLMRISYDRSCGFGEQTNNTYFLSGLRHR